MGKKYVLSGTAIVKIMIIIGLIASFISVLQYADSGSMYLFCFLLLASFRV